MYIYIYIYIHTTCTYILTYMQRTYICTYVRMYIRTYMHSFTVGVTSQDNGDKSDSSEWSSSEEEEEEEEKKEDEGIPRPSAHMNLQSKWEWLSQKQEQPIPQAIGTIPPNIGTTPVKKILPPPVAPKPKFLRRISELVLNEPGISFDQVNIQYSTISIIN